MKEKIICQICSCENLKIDREYESDDLFLYAEDRTYRSIRFIEKPKFKITCSFCHSSWIVTGGILYKNIDGTVEYESEEEF